MFQSKYFSIKILESIKIVNYQATKMRFVNKKDKSEIVYNNQITISNIPQADYEYRIIDKSANEWALDRDNSLNPIRKTESLIIRINEKKKKNNKFHIVYLFSC